MNIKNLVVGNYLQPSSRDEMYFNIVIIENSDFNGLQYLSEPHNYTSY